MIELHRAVAEIAVGFVLVLAGWSTALALRRQPPGRFFIAALLAVFAAMALVVVLGLLVLVSGHRLHDPLHLLYGAVGLVAVPAAIVLAARRPASQQAMTMVIAAIVLLVVLLRLFQTGA